MIWRKYAPNYSIEIKIIDWDASHAIEGGHFHPNIQEKLLSYLERTPKCDYDHDKLYLEEEVNEELWGKLASNNIVPLSLAD